MDLIKEIKKIDKEYDFEKAIIPILKTNLTLLMPYILAYQNNLNESLYLPYWIILQYNCVINMLKNANKKESYKCRRVADILKTTDTYQELKYEYDILLNDIAKYLKSKNIKSSKQVVLYLQKMLNSGGLSFIDSHNFYKFKYEYDYVIELLGSRVMTGLSVCRHNASFMTDVINKYGYSSYTMPVFNFDKNKISISKAKMMSARHLISAIIDENGKYAYDATGGRFVSSSPMYDEKFLYELNRHYYLFHMCKDTEKWHNEFRSDYKENEILPFEQIDELDLRELEREIESLYISEDKLNKEFYNAEAKRIDKVAYLSTKVIPGFIEKTKKLEIK